jgi:hypothetical protein
MSVGAIIIIAIAATGVLIVRFSEAMAGKDQHRRLGSSIPMATGRTPSVCSRESN